MKHSKDISTAFISIFNCEGYYTSRMESHPDRPLVYFQYGEKYYKLANLYIRNSSYKLELKSLFKDWEPTKIKAGYSYKRLNREQVLELLRLQKDVYLALIKAKEAEAVAASEPEPAEPVEPEPAPEPQVEDAPAPESPVEPEQPATTNKKTGKGRGKGKKA